MTRCMHCGAERDADQCGACGLTAAAAAILFRRRLLHLTASLLLGALVFLAVSQAFPPLDLDAMLIFAGALALAGLGLAVALDRRSRQHAELELLRRIFRALVPVPWLLALVLAANGQLDTGPPVERPARVVGKFTMPGLIGSSRVVVVSWRPGRDYERLRIPREDWVHFQRGETVIVYSHRGLLGIPWVSAVRRP
jgi:hypothetical protein